MLDLKADLTSKRSENVIDVVFTDWIEQLRLEVGFFAGFFCACVGHTAFHGGVAFAGFGVDQFVVNGLGFFKWDRAGGFCATPERLAAGTVLKIHQEATVCFFKLCLIHFVGGTLGEVECDVFVQDVPLRLVCVKIATSKARHGFACFTAI